jgi:hypothetical protein
MLKINKIAVSNDYKINVLFENGTEKICNLKSFINKGDFVELKNITLFRKVKNCIYGIEWPNDLDLSSDTLYQIGKSTKKGGKDEH